MERLRASGAGFRCLSVLAARCSRRGGGERLRSCGLHPIVNGCDRCSPSLRAPSGVGCKGLVEGAKSFGGKPPSASTWPDENGIAKPPRRCDQCRVRLALSHRRGQLRPRYENKLEKRGNQRAMQARMKRPVVVHVAPEMRGSKRSMIEVRP